MQKIKWPGGDLGYRTPQAFRGWWEIREMLLSVPVKRKVESVTKGKKIKLPQACFVDSKGREEEVDVYPDWFSKSGLVDCDCVEDCETPREIVEEAQVYLWNQVAEAILEA